VNNVDIEYIVLAVGVLAVAIERSYRLYSRYKDGKIGLDDLQDIVEEAKDIVDDAKEELKGEKGE